MKHLRKCGPKTLQVVWLVGFNWVGSYMFLHTSLHLCTCVMRHALWQRLIDLSLSDFFWFTPCCSTIMAKGVPIEKTSLLGFIGFSTRMTMLPSKTKSMLEAWLEQLPKLIKVVTPENLAVPQNPYSLIRWTFALRFRNLRVLLVSYGEIKQFKPSDSWEESGLRSEWRTVGIHEIWLKKKLPQNWSSLIRPFFDYPEDAQISTSSFQILSYWGWGGYSNSMNWKYSMTITVYRYGCFRK